MRTSRRLFVAVLVAALVFLLAFAAVRARLALPTITLTVSALLLTLCWLLSPLALRLQRPLALTAAVVGLAVLFLPLLWLIAVPSSHAINSWRLSVFRNQFLSSPPSGVEVQVVRSEVGLLTGNGNHCDYVVSILLGEPADLASVLAHYEFLPIRHAVSGSNSEIQLRSSPGRPLVLTITDAPNVPAFDVRCH